jgi:hypothetical protein
MSRIRIPSVVAMILEFLLFVSADRLAGPKTPTGEQTDQQFIIYTAALVGGALIFLFAAAGLLHSLRRRPASGSKSPLGGGGSTGKGIGPTKQGERT